MSMEEQLKNKIIEFARGLEMDKNKDYEKVREKFHLNYKFNNQDKIL